MNIKEESLMLQTLLDDAGFKSLSRPSLVRSADTFFSQWCFRSGFPYSLVSDSAWKNIPDNELVFSLADSRRSQVYLSEKVRGRQFKTPYKALSYLLKVIKLNTPAETEGK